MVFVISAFSTYFKGAVHPNIYLTDIKVDLLFSFKALQVQVIKDISKNKELFIWKYNSSVFFSNIIHLCHHIYID